MTPSFDNAPLATPAPAASAGVAVDDAPRALGLGSSSSFNDDSSSGPSALLTADAGAPVDVVQRGLAMVPDSCDDTAVSAALARMLLVAEDTPPVHPTTVDGIPPTPSLVVTTANASPSAVATTTATPPRAATTTTTTLAVAPRFHHPWFRASNWFTLGAKSSRTPRWMLHYLGRSSHHHALILPIQACGSGSWQKLQRRR